MILTRRAALVGLALLAHTAVAFAGDAPYLSPKDVDLLRFLPPPVAAGSAEDKAEIASVIATQKAASPERIAQAQYDAGETVYVMFGKILGPKFKADGLPLTDKLFERLGDSEDDVTDPAKKAFGRKRPYLAAPDDIKALVKASSSGSYPSGHTTRVTLEGIILGTMLPEKRAEIWARVADYAESRVVGGMHYPSDLVAGRQAGVAMAATALANPAFNADLEAATRELRAALGM